jgi:hypothetical protein
MGGLQIEITNIVADKIFPLVCIGAEEGPELSVPSEVP